jgi:hypothetical protein
MKSLAQYFNSGFMHLISTTSVLQLRINRYEDIYNKIIPFYKKYPLEGSKALDFSDFCKVAELMKNKAHLTPEGLESIRSAKSQMNRARLFQLSEENPSKL